MRVLGRLGIRAAILTNAAGGINTDFKQGALVLISDHINLQGSNPLIGPNDERFGPRFPDMTQAYWKDLSPHRRRRIPPARLRIIRRRLRSANRPELRNARRNPLFAHHRRRSGGHVHSARSNRSPPHGHSRSRNFLRNEYGRRNFDQAINHAEVMETGERVKGHFIALLRAVLPRIAADVSAK